MTIKTSKILDFPLYINGKWEPAVNGETFNVINPATGKVVAKVAKAGLKDTEKAIDVARKTFDSGVWSKKSPQDRANILLKFADVIVENAEELGYLEVIGSGATIRRAKSEAIKLAGVIKQTVEFALNFSYTENLPNGASSVNQIVREPLGVIAAITPWNFPMLLAMWKIAPALAMGNSIIVKPATNTPISTLKLAELATIAGIPDGVFNVISGPGGSIGELLATHSQVDKVAFTGSTEIGQRIMEQASKTVKRVTLELGGKSPAIVLPDADLDMTIPGILFGSCYHSGQICESGTRVLVHKSIYEQVIDRLAQLAATIKVGDPLDEATGMGPVVSNKQLETIQAYIQSGLDEGARLVYGGKTVTVLGCEEGYYIEPTIFADVNNHMKIAREEIFGPVVSIIPYSTVEEAIEIANDTIYGLAAGVWTTNIDQANEIAKELKAGTVWINDWHMMRPDAPFGGYKQSGVGRELGKEVLNEYSQTKHIHVSTATTIDEKTYFNLIF